MAPVGAFPRGGMNTTSVSLLERLQQPDEHQAWDRFVRLYTPMIYHWGRRVGLQPADAGDLVQEVFAILLRKLPQFSYDGRKSFRGWLKTVTLNKWRDHLRRRHETPLGSAAAELRGLAVPSEVGLFEEAEYRRHLVGRALQVMQADFQPTTWKACWEHVVSGRPAAEVAAELGITVGAVYAAKFRVLERLRQELQGLLD